MLIAQVRERAEARGVESLTDSEVLALLLNGRHALTHAERLLEESTVGSLSGASLSALRQHLPARSALSIAAAFELSCRLERVDLSRRTLVRPEDAARYLSLRYGTPEQEVMGGLFLDIRSRLVGEAEFFRGTINRASVCPSIILRAVLTRRAPRLILFHTHPSGDPSPSAEDLAFTRRLVDGAHLVGVDVADHLVIGSPGRFTSLRSEGAW